MSRFSEFRCSVGDWKLTKMAACNHFSFSKVCGDYFDGFSRSNQKECRKSCSSCFKVVDVYFPAVFMVGKKVSTLGNDHVGPHLITVPSFLKVNLSLSLYFLT